MPQRKPPNVKDAPAGTSIHTVLKLRCSLKSRCDARQHLPSRAPSQVQVIPGENRWHQEQQRTEAWCCPISAMEQGPKVKGTYKGCFPQLCLPLLRNPAPPTFPSLGGETQGCLTYWGEDTSEVRSGCLARGFPKSGRVQGIKVGLTKDLKTV